MAFIQFFDDLADQILLIDQQGLIVYSNSAAKPYINGDSLSECGFNALNQILQSLMTSTEIPAKHRYNLQDKHMIYVVTISRCYSYFLVHFHSIHHKETHSLPTHGESVFEYSMDHLDAYIHVIENIMMELNESGNSTLATRLFDYKNTIKSNIETYYSLTSSPLSISDKRYLKVVK